jgi:hypothetical protein
MMHLLAIYDPEAEVWVGKVKGLPIHPVKAAVLDDLLKAATLDDLLAKAWAMIRDVTDDGVEGFRLIVDVGKREASLLETLHLMRSPANARDLDEAIAEVKAGKVTDFRP